MSDHRMEHITSPTPDIEWKPIATPPPMDKEVWFYFYGWAAVKRDTLGWLSDPDGGDCAYEVSHWCDAPLETSLIYLQLTGHYVWRNGIGNP